jgi:hypothetical protein
MKISPYLTRRPHFYLIILLVVIAFLLLTLAAAMIFSDGELPQNPTPAPTENPEPEKSQ